MITRATLSVTRNRAIWMVTAALFMGTIVVSPTNVKGAVLTSSSSLEKYTGKYPYHVPDSHFH